MKSLAIYALDVATGLGASYADVRVITTNTETVETRDKLVVYAGLDESFGIGVRVLYRGGWGFAAVPTFTKRGIETAVRNAIENAKASARVLNGRVRRVAEPKHIDKWSSPFEKDPFAVSLDTKIALLLEAEKLAGKARAVKITSGLLTCTRENKLFLSTEGSDIEQTFVTVGGGIDATAFGNDEYQIRSFPTSFGGQYELGGWERIERWELLNNAQRIGDEAAQVAKAKLCPEMTTDLILGSSQVGLQIHESLGHPSELDRVFGEEENYAGASFLTPDNLGTLRYGSRIVNLTADATVPTGLGTFAYDDEGVSAQRVEIVKDGMFCGYLTSRETAKELGLPRSGGMMRAQGPDFTPLIRMTNVSLEPGQGSLDDLIADTKRGILMDTNYSWSIDDRRHNFQFGQEIGWLIKNGKKTEPVRSPSYWGITTKFWGSCDAICGPEEWVLWGIPTCAKGQPCQMVGTGHGASPARFNNIKVGVATPAEDKPKGAARLSRKSAMSATHQAHMRRRRCGG